MNKKEITKLFSFILLATGTIGLLVGEFFYDMPRSVTIIFALFNIVGLAILIFTNHQKTKE